MKQGDHLFLVDGSGYIFRAYHALPPLTRKSDNLPVGALAGFCNMLWKLLADARNTSVGVAPTHFAVIFDYSSKTFRNEIFPEYKANRTAPPEDLVPQFSLIRAATRAFNLPCIEQEGFEADDIIATYATLAERAGADVTIVSSDKDLMQLVSDRTWLYDTMKDRRIGRDEVIERWGVAPERLADLQALTGDSVDNVPGVPGIGPKTAAQLLQEYGDLETLLARADEIRQNKRRENLLQSRELVRISRQLVQLRNDVPVQEPLEALRLEEPDGARLIAFLKAMEFTTLTRRVAEATGVDAAAVEPAEVEVEWGPQAHGPDLDPQAVEIVAAGPALQPQQLAGQRADEARSTPVVLASLETVRDFEALDRWIAEARETGILALHAAMTGADPMQAELVGIGLATAPGRACYLPIAHRNGADDLLGGGRREGQLEEAQALQRLKPVLEDPAILKIGQDLKPQLVLLQQYGIDMQSFDDTMLISYCLDAGRGGHDLSSLAGKWLAHESARLADLTGSGRKAIGFEAVGIDEAAAWCGEQADLALRLWRVLRPRLVAERLVPVHERLERPMIAVLARMEQHGIMVDRQILSRLSGELAQAAAALESEIQHLAGESFNPGSPRQLGEILFGKMGLPGGTRTRTGQWSTTAQVLEELAAEGHELPRKIVDWRQLTKLKSTYTDALPGYIHPRTGRIHTSFALASTSTGRLSSSEPNLQNIPIRTAEGRRIRTAFIAGPGNRLLSADYSQIELRVLAHMADIPQLRQAFADGIDIHAMTASEMFGIPVEGMPPEVRRRAKAINFGIIYGISAFGLAAQLSIPRSEAAEYIRQYFIRFPGIRDYMEATKALAREQGYVETIFGRRAHYPEIRSSNPQVRAFNERAAINAPIQGSAADILRRAMIRMDPALHDAGLSARMLLQVHDELVFELPAAEVEAAIPVIRNVMENAAMPAVAMLVPLQVEARAAGNWGEAH